MASNFRVCRQFTIVCAIFITALFFAPLQTGAISSCPPNQGVNVTETANDIQICNKFFLALIAKANGELYAVYKRNSDGSTSPSIVVGADRFLITLWRGTSYIMSTNLSATRPAEVKYSLDFYARIVTHTLVPGYWGLHVERTYEFTYGPHIYEQCSFLVQGGNIFERIDMLQWEIGGNYPINFSVATTSDELYIQLPNSKLGGLNHYLKGYNFRTEFETFPGYFFRRLVRGGSFMGASTTAQIDAGCVYIVGHVISIGSSGELSATSDNFKGPDFQFYQGFGLRSPSCKDCKDKFTFISWCDYTYMNWHIPITSTLDLDLLIRVNMYLHDRIADEGWPRWWASQSYPLGDIFTAHSRSFPQMIYLWAYLSLFRDGNKWIHLPGDSNVIYHQLQALRNYYEPNASKNFEDIFLPNGPYYISYSAAKKERSGNVDVEHGILNTHAHALHFAWLMAEASKLYGDQVAESSWRAIVQKYHEGSKALFNVLMPARTSGTQNRFDPLGSKVISGVLWYARGSNKRESWYNSISLTGIAAGYLNAGEYEPEFAQSVERAVSISDFPDCNPNDDENGYCYHDPLGRYDARLVRAFPGALAFAGSAQVGFSGSISSASLDEILLYGLAKRNATMAPGVVIDAIHSDENKYIMEENGRKLILTNVPISTDWVPGHWEERTFCNVDSATCFSAQINGTTGYQGRWSAYRQGDRVTVMTDFPAEAHITFKCSSDIVGYRLFSREYNPGTGRWLPPVALESGTEYRSLEIKPDGSRSITISNIDKTRYWWADLLRKEELPSIVPIVTYLLNETH